MSLLLGTVLQLFEISKIFVICYDGHRMFCSCQIMSPFFQGLNDSKEFPIIDVIILLSWRESGGVIGTGVEIPI